MTDDRKTVILTGASRGIGHATVKRFSEEGWRIITCSREAVPEDCRRDPNWSEHITADLAERDELQAFVARAVTLLGDGPLHALVNNAAVSPKTPFKERLGVLNGGLDGWRQVFELNLFAPLALARGLSETAARLNLRGQVELHVLPADGHTTPAGAPQLAADWIRARIITDD